MTKRRVFIIAGLWALVALAGSCTRSDVTVPSPAGPSTLSITFELEATPNTILATDTPPMTTVKATVRKNGQAQSNITVYFTITGGPGQFSDYSSRIVAATDSTGVASVIFMGPTRSEISRDMTTTIQGQMQTNSPDLVFKSIEIRIIRAAD